MRICMASDFFYPNTGGVEAHIWQLSQCLMELGHKVVVITHVYKDRVGLQYMPNGLKVYYLPFLLYPKQNIIWPLVFHTLTSVRQILIREQIDIVHGHSAFSPMAHEVMFHAKTLGINTVFTDHSLFGFNYFMATVHNQAVKLSLLQCNHIICVSHVGKENQALKIKINSSNHNNSDNNNSNKISNISSYDRCSNNNNRSNCNAADKVVPVSVIPNAVDTFVFTPDPSQRDPEKITIVVNSRLVYRKGIDLLAVVLPKICHLEQKVQFIIAGDGPKRSLLESAVEQHDLQDRVLFLGSIPHSMVRDILVKGDIFLNTSLIEAFCMAIVEAASCGLQVVSTNVGGLPQVLPPELIKLTEPSVEGLLEGVRLAIEDTKTKKFVPPHEAHRIVERNYSWRDVAKQTEKVYTSVAREPVLSLKDRIKRYRQSQPITGMLFIITILINHLLLLILDLIKPRPKIRSSFMEGGDTHTMCNGKSSTTTPSSNGVTNGLNIHHHSSKTTNGYYLNGMTATNGMTNGMTTSVKTTTNGCSMTNGLKY